MDCQEESGTHGEACGEYGSDSITSFMNIKSCDLQKHIPYTNGQAGRYDKQLMWDWGLSCVSMPNGQAVCPLFRSQMQCGNR